MKTRHRMPFGTELLDGGGVAFRLWAPSEPAVELELYDGEKASRLAMNRDAGGMHELQVPQAGHGTRYRFVIGGGAVVPDPASRSNPEDVAGASAVVDPTRFIWSDDDWRGRPWAEAVVYELHVGAFTAEGSFAAAAEHLPQLAKLGITTIELMPVADFPGARGWGYDGVLLFAPEASYGSPDDLKAFIDRAHALGLMVLLDVVYNHFGPEGNWLHAYCPEFFNAHHPTPWGSAINFDGAENARVRDFYRHNALYWVEEFHLDGLRLDAVHAIRDDSAEHIVTEIARALRDGPGRTRHVHLMLENDANEASKLERDAHGAPRVATAQWNDDLHHAAHVLLTNETEGYYADYASRPLERLGRALAEGFVYQGEPMPRRPGEHRGEPSSHLPSIAFVAFLQNHDQIGNRAMGDRLHTIADAARLEALYALLLLSPHVPMFFMGEEFASSSPFPYFCDFHSELAEAVSTGRRAEFSHFAAFRDEAALAAIPDASDAATFEMAKLRWHERDAPVHRDRLALIRMLLTLRHRHLTPRLGQGASGGSHQVDGDLLGVQWELADGSAWHMAANFGPRTVSAATPTGLTVYARHATHDGREQAELRANGLIVTLKAAPETPSGPVQLVGR
jgi:maltooligosyltrehalose trehalohydrolase